MSKPLIASQELQVHTSEALEDPVSSQSSQDLHGKVLRRQEKRPSIQQDVSKRSGS